MASNDDTLQQDIHGTPAPRRAGTRRSAREKAEGSTPGDRREMILAAAARRFAEYGFEATTVRQIADDVNILSGSLYHHFSTKEEMLDEIVREPVLRMRDKAVAIAALPIDAEQRLVTIIRAELEELTLQQEVFAISFNERKFFRRSPLFDALSKAKRASYDAWSTIIGDGVREGQFRADTDVYMTISTVVRMLHTGADWFKNEDGSVLDSVVHYPLEQLLDFYLGFVLRAIRAPDRAGEPIPRPAALP